MDTLEEMKMNDSRREYLNDIAARQLFIYCESVVKDENNDLEYKDKVVRWSVFALSYVMEDTDFDSMSSEVSMKIGITNLVLGDDYKLDFSNVMNQLKEVA